MAALTERRPSINEQRDYPEGRPQDDGSFWEAEKEAARQREDKREREPDALGPCGCIDYHVADCPRITDRFGASEPPDVDDEAYERDALFDDDPPAECEGHPAGPFDPMGVTVFCDGSCRP